MLNILQYEPQSYNPLHSSIGVQQSGSHGLQFDGYQQMSSTNGIF